MSVAVVVRRRLHKVVEFDRFVVRIIGAKRQVLDVVRQSLLVLQSDYVSAIFDQSVDVHTLVYASSV